MGRCDIEAVSAWIDGELREESAARLRGHLEECPSCRALADDLAALKDGFAMLETEPPDTLAPGIMYKIRLEEDPPRKRRIVRSLVGVAACLVAVLVISRVMESPRTDLYDAVSGLKTMNAPEAAPADRNDGAEADAAPDERGEPSPGGAGLDESQSLTGGEPRDCGGAGKDAEDNGANPAPAAAGGEGTAGSAGEGLDYAAFVELLNANGISFTEDLTVFSYASYEDMEQNAPHIDTGSGYYFKKDLLIVLYAGEDESILHFLKESLGEPFAGDGHINP